jgi:hypothetical protein
MVVVMATSRQQAVPRVQVEASYLPRTYKRISRNPVIARTELVANAWDTSDSQVEIPTPTTLPLSRGIFAGHHQH